jgi:hypothetical protein
MGHGPAETIEHAQHAQHAAHDNYDRTVTISIAILAAGLACVTILSHKTHNLVLSKQIEAGLFRNDAADKWNEYQANNIRKHMYETDAEIADFIPSVPEKKAERDKALARWNDQITKYKKVNLPRTMEEAKSFTKQSQEKFDESIHVHHKAERLDLGDLGLQLGVVLASLAILTKRRAFWAAGVVCGIAGFLWAMSGYFEIGLSHGTHETHAASHESGSSPSGHGAPSKSEGPEKSKGH